MSILHRPTLENGLVRLRPLVPADREPLYLVARDRLLWEQHQCSDRHERPVFDAFFDECFGSANAFAVEHRATDRIVGGTRLRPLSATATEIGWTFLDRSLWGTDYNRAMKDFLYSSTTCSKRGRT